MDGFFFRSHQPLPPGVNLKFLLVLPGVAGALQPARARYLKGTVEVVRIFASADGSGFGIGCRMSSYSVFVNSDLLTTEEILAAHIKEDGNGTHSGCSGAAWLLHHK
jgi:hypothetical protein